MDIVKILFTLAIGVSTTACYQATSICSLCEAEMRNEIDRQITLMHSMNYDYFDRGLDKTNGTSLVYRQSMAKGPGSLINDDAFKAIVFTQLLLQCKKFGTTVEELMQNEDVITLANSLFKSCKVDPPSCENQENAYRTADGTCNNIGQPLWGAAGQAQERLLPPKYEDGVSEPRGGRNSNKLPNPREISNKLHAEKVKQILDKKTTVLTMQYGQLIAHDFILSPTIKGEDGASIDCCAKDREQKCPESCAPISIYPNDPFYGKRDKCMNLVRVVPANVCPPAYREQVNALTSAMDASFVYGSSEAEMRNLRSFINGQLRSEPPGVCLPTIWPGSCVQLGNVSCFVAGDVRVNVNPSLSAIHTVFLRLHNGLATKLSSVNENWVDETIFQETRKLMGALVQHITYNEFLPIILGKAIMKKYGLNEKKTGYDNVYNPTVRLDTVNSFGVAAFRYGHSMINKNQRALRKDNSNDWEFKLPKTFLTPFYTKFRSGADGLMRWVATFPSQTTDRFFTESVRNELFGKLDLVAINIQRGREQGISDYNTFRRFFGLQEFKSQGSNVLNAADHDDDTAQLLNELYKNDDDIDLYSAGISENKIAGAQVGPTFAHIMATQFKRFKEGDRYYFENKNNDNPKVGFTEVQVNEIKKMSMSKVLCMTIDIDEIQKNAFLQKKACSNPRMKCADIPSLDISVFRQSLFNQV